MDEMEGNATADACEKRWGGEGRNRPPPSERVHFAGGLADNNNVIIININVAAVLSSGANAFFRKTGRFASDFFQFFAPRRAERSALRTTLTIG